MQFSYNWLQKHFEQKLPTPAEIEDGVIFHSFEVEGIEKKADDSLLEIKILPDRAHDCLCHEGVAREISAIFKLPLKNCAPKDTPGVPIDRQLEIKIADPKLCRRYIGRLIEGIKVGESPAWLREKLEGIGQRSINNIVDATNYGLW
ncbi:MAG: phenylalanine--tRNA ligase beta subunit-related protein [Candidatus Vogelbacteria bacterium]|nr:phenylalanine--tRNA ligase beta subunit-related protein [Candidatus Vogelbacteria bacterium]